MCGLAPRMQRKKYTWPLQGEPRERGTAVYAKTMSLATTFSKLPKRLVDNTSTWLPEAVAPPKSDFLMSKPRMMLTVEATNCSAGVWSTAALSRPANTPSRVRMPLPSAFWPLPKAKTAQPQNKGRKALLFRHMAAP